MKQETNGSPAISVIVPIYNAEKTIRKCVDSLLAQTFEDFEVLLIDDGSPDECGVICDEYAKQDSRVRVIHQENQGVSAARQCGIDRAQGEYTIHADPDDWVEPEMLEELYQKAKEDDADMVICDFYINTYEGQHYLLQKPSCLQHDIVLKELFEHLHGSCCNKMIKLSCYKKWNIQFPISLSRCEDQYVMAALLKHDIIVSYLSKAYYHYLRDNPSSLSRVYTKQSLEEDIRAREMFFVLLEGTDFQQKVYDKKSSTILYGAFYGGRNSFTSKEFCNYFSDYWPLISTPFKIRKLLIKLSCCGYYQLSIGLFDFIQRLKHLFVHVFFIVVCFNIYSGIVTMLNFGAESTIIGSYIIC